MRSRLRLIVGGLAVLALVAALGGATWSAFSSQTENSANSVATAATFSDLAVANGSYIGDGVDNRQLNLPFDASVVIVKADTNQIGVLRTSTMTGDAAKPMTGGTALTANLIQSLPAGGFTIGTDARVNSNGVTYRWTAFKAAAANLKVGTYTGNGGASQNVTGVGFSPEYTIVASAGASAALSKMTGMPRSFEFATSTGITNGLTAEGTDGFTVGNSAQVNSNGQIYHYVAFAERSGSMDIASYTGTGVNGAAVNSAGFLPGFVIVRSADTATGRQGRLRSNSLTGTASQFFSATANANTGITALTASGFTVGTDGSVNANGIAYWYAAFKNTANGCSAPGSATVIANSDSWIDQASPTSNSGSDATLKVTSKTGNANTRALVGFPMPALPSGCSVTGATLRVRNKAPVAGRTLQALRNTATWAEGSVNWNNQPATGATVTTATTPAAAGWMQWSVTGQVQEMYAGSAFGFKIRDATENAGSNEQQFDSREATANDRPQLIVTFG